MLKVTDMYTAYGQSEALHGISFEGHKNETVAIMGRNGMGKTTLFKEPHGCAAVFEVRSHRGRGQDVSKDESYKRVARHCLRAWGRMIFPRSRWRKHPDRPLENSRTKQIPDEITRCSRAVGHAPAQGGNLSGGQQQQLAIAALW